ncbi:MAG TPA: peptidoglycan-binding domain-containing protein [Alphaproteobacteria bacterium]|nr:peptidoglycan-binding domain-containing protein [Alphaproteobacteria bacterium]
MPKIAPLFAGFILGTILAFAPVAANASTHHHSAHHHAHHWTKHHAKKHHARKYGWDVTRHRVRTAQACLIALGYNTGPVDGLMGPKTRAALRHFQKDHHLRADGRLTQKVYGAVVNDAAGTKTAAAVPPSPPPDFFATHPSFNGYFSPDYANPVMLGSPQGIDTRYGHIEIGESGSGATRQYTVTLDGASLLTADGQPSPILISKVYQLDDADAILFTAWSNDALCPYRHQLLVVGNMGHNLHPIENCTRVPQAYVLKGQLFIRFPESNDGPPTGAMWRYDHGRLDRL